MMFATSCDSQGLIATEDVGGEVSFFLNGAQWAIEARVSAAETGYGFLIGASWPDPSGTGIAQILSIVVPDLSDEVYPTARRVGEGGKVYGVTLDELDGDALLATWQSVGPKAEEGGLRVIRYDSTSGAVEIEFEGTFVGGRGGVQTGTLPETLSITNGRLRTVVYRPQ